MNKEILIQTAKEYFEMGTIAKKNDKPNSAVILFFKALVALADLYIIQKTNKTPSSHTERFKITKEQFNDIYQILDKDFPFYQDSYTQLMSLELAEVLEDDAKTLAKKTNTIL